MKKTDQEIKALDNETGEILDIGGVYYTDDGLPCYDKCNLQSNDHLGYDDHKNIIVVHEIPTDLWKEMDVEAQGCGLKNMLSLIIKSGQDVSILSSDNMQFGDTTLLPDNINDQFNQAKALKADYSKLPDEITGGLSLNEFIAALGDQDVVEFVKKQIANNSVKETATNEQKQD